MADARADATDPSGCGRLSPATVGLVISVGGIGAFAGAVVAGPMGRVRRLGVAMGVALALGQAASLLVPLAASAGRLAIACLVVQQLFGDALLGAYHIHALSLRQRVLPAAMLGRANATFHALAGVMLPAGALVAGPLAGAIGIVPAVWIAALGGQLAAPVLLASRVPRVRLGGPNPNLERTP